MFWNRRLNWKVCGPLLFTYAFVGWFVFVMCYSNTFEIEMPVPQAVGVAVLWPLFALKYLAIGIWTVLYSGFSTLIGA